jgi:hypothetical protein
MMKRMINTAGVIGAGIMGGGIAALLASAGIKTLLLDIVPLDLPAGTESDPKARNRIVQAGLDAVLNAKPALLMQKSDAARIQIGNLEDDFEQLADCDWIVEVVVENLGVKQNLLKRLETVRKTGAIVSTNTSGIPLAKMAAGRSDDFHQPGALRKREIPDGLDALRHRIASGFRPRKLDEDGPGGIEEHPAHRGKYRVPQGHLDGGKRRTTAERTISDHRETGRQGHIGKTGALAERLVADRGDTFRNGDPRKVRPTGKRIVGDVGHRQTLDFSRYHGGTSEIFHIPRDFDSILVVIVDDSIGEIALLPGFQTGRKGQDTQNLEQNRSE